MAMSSWLIFQPMQQAFGRYVPESPPSSWAPIWQPEEEGDDEPSGGADTGDNDNDTLPNWHEILLGTNCGNPDTDGDDATDAEEVYIMGTDPLSWDTNGNGISDLVDWLASRPPVITSSSSLGMGSDQSVDYLLTADYGGGSYSWGLSGAVPSGVSLSGGTLSIAIGVVGTYSFDVTVTAANGLSGSQTFTVTVYPPTPAPQITSTSPLPNVTTGNSYNFTFAATSGNTPYIWSIPSGTLPPGLIFSTDGTISGTPTDSGTWAFAVLVTDSDGQSSSGSFSIIVDGETQPLQISSSSFGASVGTACSFNLEASGGVSPYSWSLAGGSELPPGLTLNGSGVLSGTAAASPGSWNFTVEVADSDSQSTQAMITFDATAQPVDNDGDGLTDQLEAEISAETGITLSDSSATSNPYGYNDWYVWYFWREYANDRLNDVDGDGLGPILEDHLGTSPDNFDLDGDFRPDWWVFYQACLAYVDEVDADGDGLRVELELLLGTSDVPGTGWDSDGDGLSDGDEWSNIAYSDPVAGDTEGDGLWDGAEVSYGTQARLQDTDGDYLTDAEEVVVFASYGLNPLIRDTDNDGVPDFYEVPLVDTDGGGIPDALEDYWLLDKNDPTDEGWDIDGDGMTNLEEYHTGFDICGQFYCNYDFDGDGMTNVWEIAHGLNPRDPYDGAEDPDGDWWFNVEEFRNHTDPHSLPANPDSPPPEYTASLNRSSDRQWDADWDGDGVINLTELQTPSNPRLAPPPSCACGHSGCELTFCTSSSFGVNCDCHTITPPPGCSCGHLYCPGGNCTSSWDNCTCSNTPPPQCGCGHTGCEGASCSDSAKGTDSCGCHTTVPCGCSESSCPAKSGGTCQTAGPSCACDGSTNPCNCSFKRQNLGCSCESALMCNDDCRKCNCRQRSAENGCSCKTNESCTNGSCGPCAGGQPGCYATQGCACGGNQTKEYQATSTTTTTLYTLTRFVTQYETLTWTYSWSVPPSIDQNWVPNPLSGTSPWSNGQGATPAPIGDGEWRADGPDSVTGVNGYTFATQYTYPPGAPLVYFPGDTGTRWLEGVESVQYYAHWRWYETKPCPSGSQ